MVKTLIKNVENNVENLAKTLRKSCESFCKTFLNLKSSVEISNLTEFSHYITTIFSTIFFPLNHPNLSHIFTTPTTKTTIYNKLVKERI